MKPPRWYTTLQSEWTSEDYAEAIKAGHKPDPPPFDLYEPLGADLPSAPTVPESVSSFRLNPRRSTARDFRGRAIDAMLDRLVGVRPRRR